ncbi:DUF7346 family protein [Halapricum hydrolyticum]|uniref:Uncharacterized protein n=1 Tax=Halapricum hydrolyticum TaxID=2979991 RepID=A0AAE3LF81_9EURY|nr:hypothetical protein [Halapricum hydrolyticum]MCU4718260.1 hypothetical protein [Halapricum hydrolyticum]MCU4727292.1 hypothetical protein [Halapricum hydrolyticum]
MRLVSDGEAYCIHRRSSGGECRVRELSDGAVTTRPCSELTPVDPGGFAERFDVPIGVSGPRERSGRALALLLELAIGGAASVRQLLDRFDACESELHGTATELRAAGLIETTTVHGQRGYRATEATRDEISTGGVQVHSPPDLD